MGHPVIRCRGPLCAGPPFSAIGTQCGPLSVLLGKPHSLTRRETQLTWDVSDGDCEIRDVMLDITLPGCRRLLSMEAAGHVFYALI